MLTLDSRDGNEPAAFSGSRKKSEYPEVSLAGKTVSRLVTVGVAVVFALFLKPTVPDSLQQLGLPCALSQSFWDTLITIAAIAGVVIYIVIVRIDLFGALVTCLVGFILVSTLFNNQDLSYWAVYILPCAATALATASLSRNWPTEILRGVFAASAGYLILNFIFLCFGFAESGFARCDYLFYGYRNITYQIAIPAFACSLLLDMRKGKAGSFRTMAVFLLVLFEVLVGYSATTAFACFAMGAAVLLARFVLFRKIFNGGAELGVYIATFLGIVVFRLQQFAAFFFEGVLKRDVSFTGRTAIWDRAFEFLDGIHGLVGCGTGYALPVRERMFYAHNDFLHVALMGGIGAVAALLGLLGMTARKLFMHRTELIAGYFVALLLPFFAIALTESVFCPGFFFVLATAYYSMKTAA